MGLVDFFGGLGPGTGGRDNFSSMLAIHYSTAVWMQNLSCHIRRIVRGKKHKARRNFLRLAGPTQGNIGAKRFDIFRRKCRWNKRCPDRTRGDTVYPNGFIGKCL